MTGYSFRYLGVLNERAPMASNGLLTLLFELHNNITQ